MFEQRCEEAAQDHRVSDIGDEELVEAQHASVSGDVLGYGFQWGFTLMQYFELGVHVMHEAVEVSSTALGEGQALVEEVHHPGLAAAYAAPEIQASNGLSRGLAAQSAEPAPNDRAVRFSSGNQTVAQIVQAIHDRRLHRVTPESALRQLFGVKLAKGHWIPGRDRHGFVASTRQLIQV